MISPKRKQALTKQALEENVEGDIALVLDRALTAGELIDFLKQFSPDTPVELEIPVEIEEGEEMISEVGYLIDMFETQGATEAADVITLRACKPDLLEAYEAFEADEEN